MHPLTDDIEKRLAAGAPDVEVLLVEVVSGDTLRLFIDRDVETYASPRHLKRLMTEYVRYYHDDRTHLALEKHTPANARPSKVRDQLAG